MGCPMGKNHHALWGRLCLPAIQKSCMKVASTAAVPRPFYGHGPKWPCTWAWSRAGRGGTIHCNVLQTPPDKGTPAFHSSMHKSKAPLKVGVRDRALSESGPFMALSCPVDHDLPVCLRSLSFFFFISYGAHEAVKNTFFPPPYTYRRRHPPAPCRMPCLSPHPWPWKVPPRKIFSLQRPSPLIQASAQGMWDAMGHGPPEACRKDLAMASALSSAQVCRHRCSAAIYELPEALTSRPSALQEAPPVP